MKVRDSNELHHSGVDDGRVMSNTSRSRMETSVDAEETFQLMYSR